MPFDHAYVRPIPGAAVALTVAVSIASLKSTTTSAVARMFAVPSAGVVDRIRGGIPAVRNRHGFGTGPAMRPLPSVSFPDRTTTV